MNRAGQPQSPAPAFVTAVYGPKYAAFIAPLLDSIRTHSHQAKGVVLYQDIPLRELNALAHAYPDVDFVHHDFPTGSDVMHAIPRKFHAWTEGARRFADSPVLFLDIDTVLMRPVDDMFDGDWDLLFTWKDELFPINTGVMAARKGELAVHVFTAMLTRIERIIASKQEFQQAVGSSGAVDQHALREVIGFCNYDSTFYRPVTANGETREIVFKGEPCRLFNETNCRAIDSDLRIIHYKTGWHPILLENADFTKNRPASACSEMFKHWHSLEQHASDHVARSLAVKGARAHIDRFLDIAGGYEERGILHSEMLAVCGISAALDVDVIVESGRCRGQSTLVLARFFEGTRTKVVSIELIRDENAAFAEQRLAPHRHVELHYGSADKLLPAIFERFPDKRIALLLDGPKGQEAVDLARDAFAKYPQLQAAFIHDMRIDTPQRPAAIKEPMRAFFTDDPAYLKEFGSVDEACLPRQGQPITVHTWRPYMKGDERIPAYGPTLGVFLPRPAKQPLTQQPIIEPKTAYAADKIPNRLLRIEDWKDPRYAALRETFNVIYRDELKGSPHPSHAKYPDQIVTHWSREWEYPYAVINSEPTPGMRIVDLGCGGSPLIPYFVNRVGCKAAGVDLNLTSTAGHTLRGFPVPPEEVFPQVTWALRSMADTGLPAGQWDRVLCISVLEHVTEDLARETLREIKRLLAPKGRSVITTDVDGSHRTLTIDYRRILQLANEEGLKLRGEADFTVPPSDHRPGTYDVVGMVFESK